MKKLSISILLVLLPWLVLNAQKIEKDYYDQFTGKRAMYTQLEKINWGYKNDRIGGKMQLRFVLNDDFQYLVLHWYTKRELTVATDAEVQFKLDNGHLITLNNEHQTVATRGGTKISKKDVGVTLNCLGEVPKFATAMVIAIRIHTSEGYFDFDINKKDAKRIHEQYLLFNKQTYVGTVQ